MSDPRTALASNAMSGRQILAVGLCIALNALDGFDVLSISFAAPGIAAQWGIDSTALGIVLSMELIGMAVGSIVIGNLADAFGRRPAILLCLAIMCAGMFAAPLTTGIATLSAARLFTGLGLGGMLASTNALVAELSNDRRKNLILAVNLAGYPLGAIFGGLAASALLSHYGEWRPVFVLGGVASALMIPAVLLWLPESVESLIARRPSGALAKVNAILVRFGHAPCDALPTPEVVPRSSILSLFDARYVRLTLLLTFAYFAQVITFYFILKWVPKIVSDLGHTAATAGGVLVWANVGGALGAVLLGLVAQRLPLRRVLLAALLLAFASVAMFGSGQSSLATLSVAAAVAGFFNNAAIVGLYALMARSYPAALRATGTGFAIGTGRGGSTLALILAGALFNAGASVFAVSLVMGSGALLAAAALMFLPRAQRKAAQSIEDPAATFPAGALP